MKKKKEQEVISRLSTVATSLLEAVKHGQLFHGSTPYATNGEKEKKKREVISRLKTVTTSLLEAVQHRQFFDVSAPCRTLQSKVISRPYTTAISPVETRATYSHFTT